MSQLALDLIAKEKIEKTGVLDLGNCGLTEIPKSVFDLKWLHTLNLTSYYFIENFHDGHVTKNQGKVNSIIEIPKQIKRIRKLKSFCADGQKISNIDNLRFLTHLKILTLEGNQIKDISSLSKLSLRYVNLSHNNIIEFPIMKDSFISILHLRNNQITKFQDITAFPLLSYLDLGSNEIRDISFLKDLKDFTTVDINCNQIEDISSLYESIKKNPQLKIAYVEKEEISPTNDEKQIKYIWNNLALWGNPLKNPPSKVVLQGTEAIINHFDQLKVHGEDYLFEAKMIILGESGAGKTTFFRKIKNNDADLPKEEETTLGIKSEPWYFEISSEDIDKAIDKPLKNKKAVNAIKERGFRVNRWDFGGQEIYHSTHQFFLSQRSFYVLLADTREQKTDFNYWLNIAEQRSGESPLIVILNEKDGRHTWRIDEYGFKQRFPFYKETYNLNLAEKTDFTKLELLRDRVKDYVLSLPHIGDTLPANWVKIRLYLSSLNEKYISLDKFREICKEHSISKIDDILTMSQYFHDIGVFIHFHNNSILKNRIFLDANWTTETIYDLLNDRKIKDNLGRFSKNYVHSIWNDEDCLLIIDELLELLNEFGLAYPVDKNNFIIPQLLSQRKPYERWQYENEAQLLFSYTFDKFMPRGLMSRLIVALHQYIYDQNLVWLKGVNLKREDAFTEVVEQYGGENRFDIRIAGKDRRDLLITITNAFDKILEDYPKLKYNQKIPCNCDECKIQTDFNQKSFYDYDKLKKRLNKGKKTIECEQTYDDVEIEPMLYDVFGKSKEPTDIEKELARLGRRDKETFRQTLEAWLPDYSKLADGGIEFLIKAEAEYDNTLKINSDNFHSFVQQYGLAIENEFKTLYTNYHIDLRNRLTEQTDIDNLTSGNTGHGNFARYVRLDKVKKYTFEEMILILKKADTETSDLFNDFNDFLLRKYDVNIILDHILLDNVNNIRGAYRNNVSHANGITFNRSETDNFKRTARIVIQNLVKAKL